MRIDALKLATRTFWSCAQRHSYAGTLVELLRTSLGQSLKTGRFDIELSDEYTDGVPGLWDLEMTDDARPVLLNQLDHHHIDLLMLMTVATFELARLLRNDDLRAASALSGSLHPVPALFPDKELDIEAFESSLFCILLLWTRYNDEIKDMLASILERPRADLDQKAFDLRAIGSDQQAASCRNAR